VNDAAADIRIASAAYSALFVPAQQCMLQTWWWAGQKILVQAHRAFDEQMEEGFTQFLERYDPDELKFIVRTLQDFLNTPFLNLEIKSKS
jgi:hypothetical protein